MSLPVLSFERRAISGGLRGGAALLADLLVRVAQLRVEGARNLRSGTASTAPTLTSTTAGPTCCETPICSKKGRASFLACTTVARKLVVAPQHLAPAERNDRKGGRSSKRVDVREGEPVAVRSRDHVSGLADAPQHMPPNAKQFLLEAKRRSWRGGRTPARRQSRPSSRSFTFPWKSRPSARADCAHRQKVIGDVLVLGQPHTFSGAS